MKRERVVSCIRHDGWRERWILTPACEAIPNAVRQDCLGVPVPRSVDWPVAGVLSAMPGGVQTLVVRGIAYFRRCGDQVRWIEWCRRQGLSLPVLCMEAVVCRDDLLFEFEIDAWRPA